MTAFFRFFVFMIVVTALIPVSRVYAQELNSQSCGQAVGGIVPTVSGYCDVYQRQIEYKKNAKAYRDSLDARREAFETPRTDALERYRSNIETLYAKESEEYQEQITLAEKEKVAKAAGMSEESEDAEMDIIEDEENDAHMDNGQGLPKESGETQDVTAEKNGLSKEHEEGQEESLEEETGLKEKIIEPASEDENEATKKIIMPADAPPF